MMLFCCVLWMFWGSILRNTMSASYLKVAGIMPEIYIEISILQLKTKHFDHIIPRRSPWACEFRDLPQGAQSQLPVHATGGGHEEGQHAGGNILPILPIDPKMRIHNSSTQRNRLCLWDNTRRVASFPPGEPTNPQDPGALLSGRKEAPQSD